MTNSCKYKITNRLTKDDKWMEIQDANGWTDNILNKWLNKMTKEKWLTKAIKKNLNRSIKENYSQYFLKI